MGHVCFDWLGFFFLFLGSPPPLPYILDGWLASERWSRRHMGAEEGCLVTKRSIRATDGL